MPLGLRLICRSGHTFHSVFSGFRVRSEYTSPEPFGDFFMLLNQFWDPLRITQTMNPMGVMIHTMNPSRRSSADRERISEP